MSVLKKYVKGRSLIHPITLSFASSQLNDAFQEYYMKRTLKLVRLSLILAISLIMTFSFLDQYMVPEAADSILQIRIASSLFCIVFLAVISRSTGKEYLQFFSSVAVVILGIAVVSMILLAEASGGYFYYAGLLLVIMWAHGALRLRFVHATVSTLLIIVLYELVAIYLKTIPLNIAINNSFFLVSTFILGMFSSYGLEYYMRVAFCQAQKLEENRKKIEAENNRKSKELAAARRMQQAMLPKNYPIHPTVEIAAMMKTATEIGGDYFDFQVSNENELIFAIGDASGHGAQAGSLVTAIKILFTNWSYHNDLQRFLQNASDSIRKMGQPKLFMALVIGRIKEHTLELAGSGLPPALVYRASSGEIEQICLKGIPLGSYMNEKYKKITIELAENDMVLFMTDGFTELLNDKGIMIGEEKAIHIFKDTASLNPGALLDHFGKIVKEWTNGHPQQDDITFLTLRAKNELKKDTLLD